ncbi:MAG: SHOCT domain-containing protein [Thermotogae bacterium]|jgi:putative membrane protein|nr:SHOCT domain-containing protein [Thermotogota bacterium]
MYYGGPYWFGWGFGWIQAIIGILIFAFFLWIILHVIRSFRWDHVYRHYRRWWYDDEDAFEILRKRYAKGEISKEEYEKIKADLEKDSKE